jgi:hypothetical protein
MKSSANEASEQERFFGVLKTSEYGKCEKKSTK